MSDAGILKPRKNAVLAIEIIVSVPAGYVSDSTDYFVDSLAWANRFYRVPVLSAVVHRDEAAPHLHILLLPLIDGRMKGNEVLGDKKRIYAAHDSFHSEVGQRYGLIRPKPQRRISSATRDKAASIIVSALQSDPLLMDRPEVNSALLSTIANDPTALLEALGIAVPHPPKSNKTFVQIMTKPCPEKKTPIAVPSKQNPIADSSRKTENHYPCVSGSEISRSYNYVSESRSGHAELSPSDEQDFAAESAYTRIRDDTHEAGLWDGDRGEYITLDQSKKRNTILFD